MSFLVEFECAEQALLEIEETLLVHGYELVPLLKHTSFQERVEPVACKNVEDSVDKPEIDEIEKQIDDEEGKTEKWVETPQ